MKEKVFEELSALALQDIDPRQGAACWELCICYFSGFGTEQNFLHSSYWLYQAAKRGILGAQAYFIRLHQAMKIEPVLALPSNDPVSQSSTALDTTASVTRETQAKWLSLASIEGYSESLADLQLLDPELYAATVSKIRDKLAQQPNSQDFQQSLIAELSDQPVDLCKEPQSIAGTITTAAASGDFSELRVLVNTHEGAVNFWDKHGNTALITAAHCGRFEALNFLLDQPGIDASICNWYDQTPLHFLNNFPDDEIPVLVDRLVDAGASIDQEAAFPTEGWGNAPRLIPLLRSCPVLQAILVDNRLLLQNLLRKVHATSPSSPRCRVCEAGSRYRKMMAVAIMLHRVEIIKILLDHLHECRPSQQTNLQEIEVWYNGELLPVWQLALRGLPAAVADLPGSFCRALMYGESYRDSLAKTLEIIHDPSKPFLEHAYQQLQQAVVSGNIDAIDILLSKIRKSEVPNLWLWMVKDRQPLFESPIFLSLRLGYRDAFDKIWLDTGCTLGTGFVEHCRIPKCRTCRLPFDYTEFGDICASLCGVGSKNHKVNLAQVALSFASVAAHQDDYFLYVSPFYGELALLNFLRSFLLGKCSRTDLSAETTEYDGQRACQPSSYLAQAILADSLWAVRLIFEKYPNSLNQQVWCTPRLLRSQTPDPYVSARHFDLLDFDIEQPPASLELTNYILLVGSYKNCTVLFRLLQDSKQHLAERRNRLESFQLGSRQLYDWEAARPELFLSGKAYHFLLLGLIKADREDRKHLWGEIVSQVAKGHSTDWYYLKLALFYANSHAVEQLLAIGWDPNGPSWAYFIRPLRLAKVLAKLNRESFGEATEKNIARYWKFEHWFSERYEQKVKGILKNIELLEQGGGYEGFLVKCHGLLFPMYISFYLLVLPFTLGIPTSALGEALTDRMGKAYFYALMSLFWPPLPLVLSHEALWNFPSHEKYVYLSRYVYLPGLAISTYLVLPVLLFQGCFWVILLAAWFFFGGFLVVLWFMSRSQARLRALALAKRPKDQNDAIPTHHEPQPYDMPWHGMTLPMRADSGRLDSTWNSGHG
jgi:hypothetical protein